MLQRFILAYIMVLLNLTPSADTVSRPLVSPQMPPAENVTISQPVNSVITVVSDQEELEKLRQMINSLQLVETEADYELITSISVYFGTDDEGTHAFRIDKNGIVRLDGKSQTYRVVGYDTLYEDLAKLLPDVF